MNIDPDAAAKAVKSLQTIATGFVEAAAALEALLAPFAGREPAKEPADLTDKFPAEFEASRPQARPVQLKLPLPPVTVDRTTRLRLGDVGYENEVNPNRQTCGQIGGLATAGVKRAPCPDRRPRGSVMVKNMSVNEKRRYWRWSKFRAAQRSAGVDPVSWAAWAGERD